jgi:hypothetical protein
MLYKVVHLRREEGVNSNVKTCIYLYVHVLQPGKTIHVFNCSLQSRRKEDGKEAKVKENTSCYELNVCVPPNSHAKT